MCCVSQRIKRVELGRKHESNLSGVVLAVGIVLCLKSPWWGFGIVIGVAAALGSNEYIRMARPTSGAGERAYSSSSQRWSRARCPGLSQR